MKKRILTPEEVGALLEWDTPPHDEGRERISPRGPGLQKTEKDEHLFRNVLDVLGEAMIVTDVLGRILFGNTLSRHMMKKSLSSIRRKPFSRVLTLLDASGNRENPDPVEVALREKERVPFPPGTSLSLPDGSTIPISGFAAPILRQAGEIEGVVVSFHRTVHRSSLSDPAPSPPRRRAR